MLVSILLVSPLCAASMDDCPKNAGGTMGRASGGVRADGLMSNPALLGCQRAPYGMMQIFPFSQTGAYYWSNGLEIPPLGDYLHTESLMKPATLFPRLLQGGLGVDGMSDSAAIARVTQQFPGGALMVAGANLWLFDFSTRRFAMGVNAGWAGEFNYPEAALAAIAGDSTAIDSSNFNFSSFRQWSQASANVSFALGFPLPSTVLNRWARLPKSSIGIRATSILGLSYVKAEADTGALRVCYRSAGPGGIGYNANIGLLMYGEHAGFSLEVKNIGNVYWLSGSEDTVALTMDDVKNSRYKPQSDGSGTETSFTTQEPAALALGYSYQWRAPKRAWEIVHVFASSLYGAAGFSYVFIDYPGVRKGPLTTLGVSSGLFHGIVPVRAGWSFGGIEKQSSALGIGFDFKNYGVDFSYKALGSPSFDASHGFEVCAAYSYVWRLDRDWDNDKVIDKNDKCLNDPEDRDGFEDSDGCPDPDNDKDGILDKPDKCKNTPEDRDGFQDSDGCPDVDNDSDGIPDSVDKCPDHPEDKDGFQDSNGCPDYDNDSDSIPDALDKCPNDPEDRDGFQDSDGCPDFDNDNDGIPDLTDDCPDRAENVNCLEYSDGCPDQAPVPVAEPEPAAEPVSPVPEPTVPPVFTIDVVVHFGYNSVVINDADKSALDSIAALFAIHRSAHFEVSGFGDSLGGAEENLRISFGRAVAVRNHLIDRGVPYLRLAAVGHGSSMPVAPNATAEGRAANRRVEFSFVGEQKDFEKLLERQREQEKMLK